MKKENDELTNLFRSRLGEAGMPVREGFWENLEKDIPVAISRRRQLIHRFTAAASVLLVLAGVSAALWYFSPKEEIANAFTQVAVSTGTFPATHVPSASQTPVSLKPVVEDEENPADESFSMSFSMSFSFSSSSSTSTSSEANTHNKKSGYNRQSSYAGGFDSARHPVGQSAEKEVVALSPSKEKDRKWSVGLYASSGLLTGRAHSEQIKPFVPDEVTNGLTSGTMKHKLPFSAGISVRRKLSDRWGIESGLVYTQLNSELTAGENTYYTQDQTLHYVGIPVKVDFSLYRNKRTNLYASAGGMVEKCISGNVETNYYENGRKSYTAKQSLKADPLQLSLIAAIGVQYKINDRLSLYAEPGLSYHFDDGSSVTNVRKEKPLNMNLLCGVRMTY